MSIIIGFNLVSAGVALVIIFVMGVDFEFKEKVFGILLEIITVALVSGGVYLMSR